jgi:hypothetical protein
MKLSRLLLALRAAACIAAVGFAAIYAKDYVLRQTYLGVSPHVYGIVALALIWSVVWLSTRKLFQPLAIASKAQGFNSTAAAFDRTASEQATTHKYPARLGFLSIVMGVVFLVLPYLSADPGKSISMATYVGCFSVSCTAFAIAAYIFTYSVTIERGNILLRTFGTRKISLADVSKAEIVVTRNGPQAVVSLKNGKIVRFGGMLTNFERLSESLISQRPE